MQNETELLISEIEAAASALGIAPSTVGERAGQGGRFYARLKSGARAWPETIAAVRDRIAEMHASISPNVASCDYSHGPEARPVQAPSESVANDGGRE